MEEGEEPKVEDVGEDEDADKDKDKKKKKKIKVHILRYVSNYCSKTMSNVYWFLTHSITL